MNNNIVCKNIYYYDRLDMMILDLIYNKGIQAVSLITSMLRHEAHRHTINSRIKQMHDDGFVSIIPHTRPIIFNINETHKQDILKLIGQLKNSGGIHDEART